MGSSGDMFLGDGPLQARIVEVMRWIALVRVLQLDPLGEEIHNDDDDPVDEECRGDPAQVRRVAQLLHESSHSRSARTARVCIARSGRVVRGRASSLGRPVDPFSGSLGKRAEVMTAPTIPAEQAEHEAVAQAALAKYASLPRRGKPKRRDNQVREWTVMAAVCLVRGAGPSRQVHCVSIG